MFHLGEVKLMSDLQKQIKQAFQKAIEAGRLSADENADNYAGLYMYMGKNSSGLDAFKNTITRDYIK